ncbi:hypothetical protein ASE41_11060 [Streptomyces sp. Root264]|nr:hypothetical protein ASE41_11060 [Streptomyces sp. Root264]
MPTLLAYRWYFAGLTTVPSTTAAVLVLLEPATAALLAILLGEPISSALILGPILLLTAIAVLATKHELVALASAQHALAGLADDAPDDNLRQTCVAVLRAYLSLPFSPDPGDQPSNTATEEQRKAYQDKRDRYLALREVRHTILRLIGDHYRVPRGAHRSWQGCNLDLPGITIDGDMDSGDATFSGGTVSFGSATFFSDQVSFDRATFPGGGVVSFGDARFSGGVVFFYRRRCPAAGCPATVRRARFLLSLDSGEA